MKVNNDEDVSISDEELSLSFASDIENAYAFLSPLSLSQNENNCSSTKPVCLMSRFCGCKSFSVLWQARN